MVCTWCPTAQSLSALSTNMTPALAGRPSAVETCLVSISAVVLGYIECVVLT